MHGKMNDAHLSGNNDHPKSVEEVMTHLLHGMDQNQNKQNDNQVMSMSQAEVECCCHHHGKGHITADCPKLMAQKWTKQKQN